MCNTMCVIIIFLINKFSIIKYCVIKFCSITNNLPNKAFFLLKIFIVFNLVPPEKNLWLCHRTRSGRFVVNDEVGVEGS